MEIKNLIEETVIHKAFGKGTIKEAYDNYLEVEFPGCGKRSKFSYPSCFDGFLRLEGGEKEKAVQEELERWREDNGIAQKEICRQQYEKTRQAIRERRLAAEEKRKKTGRRSAVLRADYNGAADKSESPAAQEADG
ncbi:MAG: hypothetical protein NC432_03150 [Roseburia sp.]|nr:hypothetical protein [Roseburia sp.]MCM1097068.1 hypothetical protein [Ruminococcus flavefaciens]